MVMPNFLGVAPTLAPVSIDRKPPGRITIDAVRVACWLAVLTAAVVTSCVLITALTIILHAPTMYGMAPLFDLNGEANIPAAYSALQLLAAAVLLFLVSRIERDRGGADVRHWSILSAGFAYLSLDELASLHEQLNRPLRALLHTSPHAATWMIAGAAGVLVVGIYFVPFLWRLPRADALRFSVAGAIFVGSAVGVETVSAVLVKRSPEAVPHEYTWEYLGLVTLEEAGEKVGEAFFIYALCLYLHSIQGRIELDFSGSPNT